MRNMKEPEGSETKIFLVARSTRLKAEDGSNELGVFEKSGQKGRKSRNFS